MRRNLLPIRNSNRNPTNNTSVASYLNRMAGMMNVPSRPAATVQQSLSQTNSQLRFNQGRSHDDSDEDYYDDYIMDDSWENSDSDGDFVNQTLAKYNKDRGATLAEICRLEKNVLKQSIEGVCSICLE